MSHLYLIGFLESGNVTVGKQLAERLKRPFCDAEAALAEFLGQDLVTAYREQGVDAFYRHQHDQLRIHAAKDTPHVIAVSDNAALREADWELLKNTGTTVYVQHSPERLYWRLRHDPNCPPLADVTNHERKERIAAMLAEREPDYLQADLVVPCKHEQVPDIVNIISKWLDQRV